MHQIVMQMLGVEVQITSDFSSFENSQQPRIAYSTQRVEGAVWVKPHGLLQQTGIQQQDVAMGTWRKLPVFFQTEASASIPFDIFAASFFLLSRYEEYLPFTPDAHGRFPSQGSMAVMHNFLHLPLVDLWAKELGSILKEQFPQLSLKKQEFTFIPTIDVDNAFAFRQKGFWRNTLGLAKNLLTGKFSTAWLRLQVLCNLKPDPFDTFEQLQKVLPPQSVWFILSGSTSRLDRPISLHSKMYRQRIEGIAQQFTIGLHPSYGSLHSISSIAAEKNALESVLQTRVEFSRHHYLRFQLPHTMRQLVQLGVTHDFSMGYADRLGFRASTCTPFRFYDLLAENVLPLSIVPFQVMDRALLQGLKLTPQQAVEQTLQLAQMVKNVGGTFVTLWHNETQSNFNEWKGWDHVLNDIIKGVEKLME